MLLNDRRLTISVGGSRKAVQWQASTLLLSELIARLVTPQRGTETVAEYLRMPKAQQDERKDVGGFVGGTLSGARRKAGTVTGRDLLTLDLDNIPAGGAEEVLRRLESLGCAYVVYSTRKHRPDAPRLRVIWPTDRTAAPDEYEPLMRKMAEAAGLLEYCDPSTFEAHRLMYWPSCCADGEYVFRYADKQFLAVDGVLGMYADWREVSGWPVVPGAISVQRLAAKQGDPRAKEGVVGAFCRTYDIRAAMNTFLPGVYEETDQGGRYTFVDGSTAGGAVEYDDGAFLYSHHATDPCGGRLVNAFDLVRLHRFGDLDDEAKEGTPVNRLPSYKAMSAVAMADEAVAMDLKERRYSQTLDAFDAPYEEEDSWLKKLDMNSNGTLDKTLNNFSLIMTQDPNLKGKIRYDEFQGRLSAWGVFPWSEEDVRREWRDEDDAYLLRYIEAVYKLHHLAKYESALKIAAKENTFHPVRDYLQGLRWDGIPRLDRLLIDYIGAEDTPYVRTVTRKAFTAAVARIMRPGVKFDTMLTLIGAQGRGKTTLFAILGGEYFSNSLLTFEGKDAMEGLQGKWILEIGELQAMNKTEMNAAKNFMSKTSDTYRAPYARNTETHLRQCVFFGTTNTRQCLRDNTGGRRFWPVDIDAQPPTKSIWDELAGERDQLWAEAVHRWIEGESIHLSPEMEAIAAQVQEDHREEHPWEGMIQEYLEKPLPKNWFTMSITQRRDYLGGYAQVSAEQLEPREHVCAIEVWCECLGRNKSDAQQKDTRLINQILESASGWKRHKVRKFGREYGPQRGFSRSFSEATDDKK